MLQKDVIICCKKTDAIYTHDLRTIAALLAVRLQFNALPYLRPKNKKKLNQKWQLNQK